jgi:glycosyltransferase involved in cell wall biosynthesis
VSVLVPARDEERTIERVLRRTLALGEGVHEVIVVDDGSRDATADRVRAVAGEDPRVRLLRHERGGGKTAAVRSALAAARGEVLVLQDADSEYDPADIPSLVRPILDGRADVVYGSRFLGDGAGRRLRPLQRLANRTLTVLSNLLTRGRWSDVETGAKAFRACVLRRMPLASHGFGIEIEITANVARTRARPLEVPVSYAARTYGEGKKVRARDGWMALAYALWFNLGGRFADASRRYVREVDAALTARRARDASSRAASASSPPSSREPSPRPSPSAASAPATAPAGSPWGAGAGTARGGGPPAGGSS